MISFFRNDPFKDLKKSLGKDKVFTSPEYLETYSGDATRFRQKPAAVVFVESTDEVQKVVGFASANEISITPRGAGSGLSGGSVPVEGGLVLSFERMNAIEKLDPVGHRADVQPGVVTAHLQSAARKHKLFYPPDPSSFEISTIGGNVAENAGGLRCFKYGVTGHYVLGLEFVDHSGRIQRTGIWDYSTSTPDLTPLMVGSEGTLGIITRIALNLIRLPEKTSTLAAYFRNEEDALGAVEKILETGLIPSVMEFIDRPALTAAAKHIQTNFPDQAMALLLVEVDGFSDEVAEVTPKIHSLLQDQALSVELALNEKQRDRLWQLRRAISPSLIRLSTGRIHEDIAVPRGQILEMSRRIKQIGRQRNLEIALYGHVGDGNLHVVILYDIGNNSSNSAAKMAARDVFSAAVELGGTITGEHGIGLAKQEYLSMQLSESNLKLAREIKKAFDPGKIFNPGKVLSR